MYKHGESLHESGHIMKIIVFNVIIFLNNIYLFIYWSV